LDWEARPNRLARALESRSGAVLDLTVSNPTRVGLTVDQDALGALADSGSRYYDPDPRGLRRARAAIGDPDRFLLTASTSEAYSFVFKLLCEPGDEVLVPRPSYPLFDHLARLDSVVVRQYSLQYHEGWWIEPDEWSRRVTERTRAVVVVNPNNPTGSYLKRADVERLEALCAERGIAIISDEVFADYQLDASSDIVPSLRDNRRALTFCLNGLSKMLGLPQMKLGWIEVAGPPALREEAMARIEWIADTYLSVGAPVQHAVEAWMGMRDAFQRTLLGRLRENLHALEPLRPLRVEGGWSAVVKLPATRSEEDWALRLLDEGVLVQPGYFYDFDSEPFAVLSLITEPATFRAGVDRLASAR
jgi:aspartate/methionine/tyrosine aminotransferase